MANTEHYRRLEKMMQSANFANLVANYASIKEGEAEITLPVSEEYFHAAGAMHGAFYFLALDNAAFFAANSLVEDVFLLTSSFTTYITRPVSEGTLKALGKVVNRTKSQIIAEAVMYNEEGKEIARGSGVFVRSRKPFSEIEGYTS
ncbi:PaaI family thioesterase [Desulfococcaceae bacterium OttesenSCG-928-F15]|nr:PaaI family thioesterase [Desulfococcaceae bacterium OttesenSCG-928-F15]